MQQVHLADRGVLKLTGPDTQTFLQGLISNDVTKADGRNAVYAALLTPQGKFLYDFFLVGNENGVLIECRKDDLPTFSKKLRIFKLRSDVDLSDVTDDYTVHAVFGEDAASCMASGISQQTHDDGTIVYRDPRLGAAGIRVLACDSFDLAALGGDTASPEAYQLHRISLGLPEAPIDLQADKSILLESGFDELNGVDWNKGCYMGQELTARTKYRGLVKKRLVPVVLSGAAEPGTDIMHNGKVVGDLRSVAGDRGLALIRLQALDAADDLLVGETRIHPEIPDWMILPENA